MARASLTMIAILILAGCGGDSSTPLPEGFEVLSQARGDLDGDGRPESVRLVGRGAVGESLFREDLCLAVDGSAVLWPLPSSSSSGYGATLALVDVTGDGRQEVLVTADTGGSGGIVAGAVVRVDRETDTWSYRTLLDSEAGPRPVFDGALADDCVARLEIRSPGVSPHREQLDLNHRRDRYIEDGVYDAAGVLREPVAIWGDAIMGLEPVAADEGGPGVRLIQQARGVANADRLAEITTVLVWDGETWVTARISVRQLD